MRKIKLTKEERAIEESLDEYVPVRGRKLSPAGDNWAVLNSR